MSFPWEGIIIHHSLTRDSQTVSWSAIRNYHETVKGWRTVGYHAGCEIVGGNYEVLMGRPIDWQGGHTRGQNSTHLGLCFVGNYDEKEPSTAMLIVACERIIRPWQKLFNIPTEKIEPHRQYANKTCPGSQFDIHRLYSVLDSLPEADY